MQIDFLCPVENQGVIVKTNSKTGENYALFKLFNTSDSVVTGVTFVARAYDAYGGELGELRVNFNDLEAQPKTFFAEKKAISLKDVPDAKHITVEFLSVTFSEGEPYIPSGNTTEVQVTEPDYEERLRLISVAGEDALCYAQDMGPYWVCVCGRPNADGTAECVRCGRNKKEVFESFSSRDGVNQAVSQKEEAERIAEEERKEQEALAAAMVKKKWKKIGGFSALGAVCLVILYFLGALALDGIYLLMGNAAQKKGDYVQAYSYYRSADSKKVGEVSELVRGNSGANIYHSGLMTADEENIYYLDTSYHIYKESKTTGEKTKFNEVNGFFLNVVDGWLYYLDPFTQQIVGRIKTDGTENQHIYENAEGVISYLSVVGDEVYFIAQEMRDDLTPELQEQIAASGNQSQMYQTRLYRMKIGKTKPVRVAEVDLLQYLVYKDRIYYLDRFETAVYSMDLNGKDNKKIISGPVYDFEISEDVLYYQDGTVIEETGFPKLSLEMADLNGNHIETTVSEKFVTAFTATEEGVYYIGMDDLAAGNANLYKKTAEGDVITYEGGSLFNLKDGYLFCVTAEGKVIKTTYDKTGFEEVSIEPAE